MSAVATPPAVTLTPAVQQFVLHWGEMGTRWGVNRTVAQIHALLYLSVNPMCAEEIVSILKVARSNVSNSLHELLKLGMIHRTHKLGDRRDHYLAVSDIWELFSIITAERKKREIDPTLDMLRQCVAELEGEGDTRGVTRRRIHEMYEFLDNLSSWYEQVARLPRRTLKALIGLGSGIAGLVGKVGQHGKDDAST